MTQVYGFELGFVQGLFFVYQTDDHVVELLQLLEVFVGLGGLILPQLLDDLGVLLLSGGGLVDEVHEPPGDIAVIVHVYLYKVRKYSLMKSLKKFKRRVV